MEYYENRDWYPELEGLKVEINLENSEIRKFYAGAKIFITGGAGFLGGLLIEKIARSCPDFGKIYLMLRPKRGLSPSERINKIFEDEVFDLLKKENPGFMSKVFLMEGDLAEPMCCLSEENQQIMRDEVNLVFHIAACMRMVEPLTTAYSMNVRATKDLLDLATNMKQLKGFVYVSTAYSNCPSIVIDETCCRPPFNWEDLRDLVEVCTEDQLTCLSPKLISEWPNTYSYTKAVTEDMVQQYVGRIPVAIARPSIVIGCANEPKKNWTNNAYGANGVAAGAAIGFIRVWHLDPRTVAEIIPADVVVNTMIAIQWQIFRKFTAEEIRNLAIYNIVSSPKAPSTWQEFVEFSSSAAIKSKVTTKKVLGDYYCYMVKNRLAWHLYFYIFHLVQGIVFDTALLLKNKEPRLLKGYIKLMQFNRLLSPFSLRNWKFEQPNVDSLLKELSEDDKKLFPFDMTNFDWKDYHLYLTRAVLRYIVKSGDDVEDPAEALKRYYRIRNTRLFILRLVQVIIFYFVLKFVVRAALRTLA